MSLKWLIKLRYATCFLIIDDKFLSTLLHLEIWFYFPADTSVFKTCSGRLKKVTTSHDQTRRRRDVRFTTSWRRLLYVVLKTSNLRRLENVWFTTSWGRLIYDVLKTSDLQPVEDVWFTTSWGRPIYIDLNTSDLRRLQDVCKTTSVWQRRNDVYTTSKEMIFLYFVLSEIFRKF